MTEEQISSIGEDARSKSADFKKSLGIFFRFLLENVLEWIASIDLLTDVIVLIQLWETEHYAWTTITIFSMTAPFIISQTPFLTFLRDLINRDKNNRFKLRFLSVIVVSPLMIVFMFVMDIVFLLNQAFLYPIFATLDTLTC